MGDVLKKFGRYFLLDQIAQGGMAEICRARLASADGAGRLMVIKRIQASYGSNSEFLQMFKSEIKVTMGFNHPNIVQLYDFGEEQNQPYIAMELVDGKNLRQFISRCAEQRQGFPVELAVYVAEQASSGLHYAHSYKDKISGEPLNIVHRDISPQNILISYEGNVKIIDFGIAKATTNLESTRAGVIKGKPSYLSPEQISGDPLDGRSDIFALGIVLWELLVGKKLFAGENELAVLKLIEACTTHVKPPSTFNPKVTKELDAIVMKALQKTVDKRYQTADELQRALHKFLYGFAPEFNPSDLAYYAKDLFKDQIVEDRKKIQRLNDEVEQLLTVYSGGGPPKMAMFSLDANTDPPKEDTTTVVEGRRAASGSREIRPDSGSSSKRKNAVQIDISPDVARARQGNTGRGGYVRRSVETGSATHKAVRANAPPQQRSEYNGSGTGGISAAVAAIAATIGLAWIGPNYGIRIPGLSSVLHPGDAGAVIAQPAPIDRNPDSVAANPKTVMLRLNVQPGGGDLQITLDGKPIKTSDPVTSVQVDHPLTLSVDRRGYKHLTMDFVVDSGSVQGRREVMRDVVLEPLRFGELTLHATPNADATFVVDGQPQTLKTPIESVKLPVGAYSIKLKNEVLGMEANVTIDVEEGKSLTKDVKLEIKN